MPAPEIRAARFDPLFGPVAPSEGWVPSLRYLLRRQRVLELAGNIAPTTLLEAGCGAGTLLADLSQRGFDCAGIETSPRAVELARKLATALGQTYRVLAEPNADWDNKFGVVCAFDVLEHIEDDRSALAQWRRWLRPDGKLMLSVPAHSHRWSAGDVWAGHYRRYDRGNLVDLLSSQELKVEHLECYGFPLANLTELLGAKTYRRLLTQRNDGTTPAAATAESGIQREEYIRRFNAIDSAGGRVALRLGFLLQRLTSGTDLGSGYLVLASRQ